MALRSSNGAKSAMLNGLSLGTLIAFNSSNEVVSNAPTATFSVSNNVLSLDNSVTITIASDKTVAYVMAVEAGVDPAIAGEKIEIDLTTPEAFPNGGNLIVNTFTVTLGDN